MNNLKVLCECKRNMKGIAASMCKQCYLELQNQKSGRMIEEGAAERIKRREYTARIDHD